MWRMFEGNFRLLITKKNTELKNARLLVGTYNQEVLYLRRMCIYGLLAGVTNKIVVKVF